MINEDLNAFLKSTSREIQEEYVRISKRVKEDPGTAGDQGEENWASLFKNWLPSNFHVVTKGRIISFNGAASPQVDVLILRPEYPEKLLDKKLYLAAGVLAAFECKITFKTSYLKKVFNNSIEIKNKIPSQNGSPYKELSNSIIYGLLAHSHDLSSSSTPVRNITEKMIEYSNEIFKHPREMIDLVCIADLATWDLKKLIYIGSTQKLKTNEKDKAEIENALKEVFGENGKALTTYYCLNTNEQIADNTIFTSKNPEITSIGGLITSLLRKISWEYPGLRSLSQYFNLANVNSMGAPGVGRYWELEEIYSKDLIEKIKKGKYLTEGDDDWDSWSEWAISID